MGDHTETRKVTFDDGEVREYPIEERGGMMDFSEALVKLKGGWPIGREGWNGKHHLDILDPEAGDIVNHSYIVIETEGGDIVPWAPSQADLLASDWRQTDSDVSPL